MCGPPSRHKDSYLTQEAPPSLSPAAPSNGTPKPGAGRDPGNTCPSGRRRRRQPWTKLRHSLTLCLFTALRLAHTCVPRVRFPSLSRRRRSEPPAVSEQSKRDSRSVGGHDVGRSGEARGASERARERTSGGTRTVSATNWKSRGDTTHAEALHIYIRGGKERGSARGRIREEGGRRMNGTGMGSGIPPVCAVSVGRSSGDEVVTVRRRDAAEEARRWGGGGEESPEIPCVESRTWRNGPARSSR